MAWHGMEVYMYMYTYNVYTVVMKIVHAIVTKPDILLHLYAPFVMLHAVISLTPVM